jgi:hypothetical protein
MADLTGMGPVPCPYKSLPAPAYWRRAVSAVPPAEIDPVLHPRFTISATDKMATAGSCFAQHIARYMKQSGFNYFVTEPGHPLLDADTLQAFNYGTFSARYGNIYTVRQLLQLLERAYGLRQPVDDVWVQKSHFIDPFRPFVQDGGFATLQEYQVDRAQHFAAVRRIVEDSDVFVFTLGLTEAWENAQDGTVYAICPGCGAGEHHPDQHLFHNFSVAEVTDDLCAAIDFIRARNPALRILLTVSPVPLIATFTDQHVLAATTYSKAVLRVAAQMARDKYDFVDYFPSLEIITSSFSRGAYYGPDLREVEEVGVAHAMRCFRHYLQQAADAADAQSAKPAPAATASPPAATVSSRINKLICDEERLEDI